MKIEKLTKQAFAAFGDVVEIEGAEHFFINQHFAERFNNLANVDVTDKAAWSTYPSQQPHQGLNPLPLN